MSTAKSANSAPKVLVVDDDSDIVELLEYNLTKEGYSVLTASNGRKAIDIAKAFVPDLILLDIMMPQLDGIETGSIDRSRRRTHVHGIQHAGGAEEYVVAHIDQIGGDRQ